MMDGPIDLNQQTYDWCVRAFDRVKKLLGVRIKLHHEEGQIGQGDIFLFNHFARMETFIPQYLIYKEAGAFCRSVAASQFFQGSDRFAQVLYELGAVPADHPNLMPLLARDILRGRKIVIFPEGGMVKDRQVLDERGKYSIYSRSAKSRRKHHTGAARLAIGLQIVKMRVLREYERGNLDLLSRWAEVLELPSRDSLIANARKPVSLVPANITFYPLRISDNILSRSVELLRGDLSQRALEELIVEGNIMFRTTDMDIRLGDLICPLHDWVWWERLLAKYLARDVGSPTDIFDGDYLRAKTIRRNAAKGFRASISRLRNRYMRDIYAEVTVNISHLASRRILDLLDRGEQDIPLAQLKEFLYLSIKRLQKEREVHLHRSLCNPSVYRELLKADSTELTDFLQSAVEAELIAVEGESITLREKLVDDHAFDTIRLENPIEVYANEIEPVIPVDKVFRETSEQLGSITSKVWAELSHDDELVALDWDRRFFDKAEHQEINRRETATADPSPFLLTPKGGSSRAVVLLHGFLATPAEMRSLGDRFVEAGYVVYGVRLKGHGTSPWDLRERSWLDWYRSAERGLRIAQGLCDEVSVVGFSTGGSLALLLAARNASAVSAVASVCAPLKFRNKNMRFVPLMHGANKVVRWVSNYEGLMPFRSNESEHPHINYRNMPIRGLYELTRLASELKSELAAVTCPTCIIQASDDHVVDPASANLAYERVQTQRKEIHWVESERHGIVNEDIGNTQNLLVDFIDRVAERETAGAKQAPVRESGIA